MNELQFFRTRNIFTEDSSAAMMGSRLGQSQGEGRGQGIETSHVHFVKGPWTVSILYILGDNVGQLGGNNDLAGLAVRGDSGQGSGRWRQLESMRETIKVVAGFNVNHELFYQCLLLNGTSCWLTYFQ